MADEQVRLDVAGFDTLTAALLHLLNEFPLLNAGESVSFNTLDGDGGIALFPISGAIITTERNMITGRTIQECSYPFYVVYRAAGLSEINKVNVKSWLDNLGLWLEGSEVSGHTLTAYPELAGTRVLTEIKRETPAYLGAVQEDQSEDWYIEISAKYKNEFRRL